MLQHTVAVGIPETWSFGTWCIQLWFWQPIFKIDKMCWLVLLKDKILHAGCSHTNGGLVRACMSCEDMLSCTCPLHRPSRYLKRHRLGELDESDELVKRMGNHFFYYDLTCDQGLESCSRGSPCESWLHLICSCFIGREAQTRNLRICQAQSVCSFRWRELNRGRVGVILKNHPQNVMNLWGLWQTLYFCHCYPFHFFFYNILIYSIYCCWSRVFTVSESLGVIHSWLQHVRCRILYWIRSRVGGVAMFQRSEETQWASKGAWSL